MLAPGRYLVRLQAFGEESQYTLTLSSSEPRLRRRMEEINGREPQRVDIEAAGVEGDLFSFDVGAPTAVVVIVKPASSDVDVVLLDEDWQVLDTSSNGNVDPERIERPVDVGTFYIRVFPYGDAEDKPGGYTLIIDDGTG